MKIISTTISENETSVEIDLFEGRALPKAAQKRIKEEVGNYLVEQTLASMGEKKSPIQGAPNFPPLSKKYKVRKLDEVGSTEANLEYDGLMKDELDFVATPNGIAVGVFGERAGAADGHNNLSGKSQLPLRQFLPDKNQNYKQPIRKEVDRIIADIVAETTSFKEKDFKDISTKSEMREKLQEIFGPLSKNELQLAVFRNEELYDLLSKLDLIDLI